MTPRRTAASMVAAVLLLTPSLAACGGSSADEIAPAQALTLIDTNDAVTVLDVRTPEEYAAGHLPEAMNVSLAGSFEEQIAGLDKGAAYVVYCTSGVRSAEASSIMVENGFTNVLDAGGLQQLQEAGADVVSGS